MSILKPRNRLINFRLTDEEFQALHSACQQQGARSVSDFARSAVMSQVGQPVVSSDLARLEAAILGLEARVGELASLITSQRS